MTDIDIEKHCKLALQTLGTIIPFATEAGIETDPELAYDEWEVLVQAVFDAFIVIPLCDTTGKYSPEQFHRLGFSLEKGKYLVGFESGGVAAFIYDLAVINGRKVVIEAKPLLQTEECKSEYISIEQCSNFVVLSSNYGEHSG